jgi:hypothetical protein
VRFWFVATERMVLENVEKIFFFYPLKDVWCDGIKMYHILWYNVH